jgi:hypothetical protein
MSCKLKYKGKEYSEMELMAVLSHDPAIIKEYGTKENIKISPYTVEEKSVFDRKIAKLKESMDVEVIMDETVDSSRVLGKGDNRTKNAGKPVILINPKQLFRETAIHEFGHVFIDSFPGGLDNPRIQKALAQLSGTALEAEVKELYPDLNREMFQKELLATAIGREGADIWENNEDLSTWGIFKDWFTNFINRTFGIPKNEVASLVNDMISGERVTRDLVSGLPQMAQELKREKIGDPVSKNTKTLQGTYDELVARISNALEGYRPDNAGQRQREAQRVVAKQGKGLTKFQSIESLHDQLLELDQKDKLLGLSKYTDWVKKELNSLRNVLRERNEAGTQTRERLVKGLQWNNAFDMVDEIQVLANDMHNNGDLSDADKKGYDEMLEEIQGQRSTLRAELMQGFRNEYAQFIADSSNEVKQGFIAEFKKNYKDAGLESSGVSIDEYVNNQLIKNADEIKERELQRAHDRSIQLDADISAGAGKWLSEKNIDSKEIQAMSAVIDNADKKISEFGSSKGGEFQKNNSQYKKDIKKGDSFNQAEKYDPMLDKSSSGKFYLASEYKVDFLEEKRDESAAISNPELAEEKYSKIEINPIDNTYVIDGKKRKLGFYGGVALTYVEGSMHVGHDINGETRQMLKEEAIAKSEFEYWKDANTERVIDKRGEVKYVPIQKWENPAFKAMTPMEKAHLEFFKLEARASDKRTDGKNSLISKSSNQEWIKLPAVKKSSAQKIADGSTLEFIKDQWSELTKVQEDDHETIASERSMGDVMRVRADGSNNARMAVPVAFRANLSESDQSLDLHSIFLMNTIASKEYQEKQKLEATALILLEVMKDRKVLDTHGVSNAPKIHASSKDGKDIPLSKNVRDGLPQDAIKMMDMIENRLYGIKSVDAGKIGGADVNQLTRSWLKLSGSISLLGNWMNDVVNYNMGNAMNLIEAVGSEHFSVANMVKARKTYWLNMKDIMSDLGSNVDTSRTNLFMNMWNVAGGKDYMNNHFEESTKIRSLMKVQNMRALAHMGEHMVQSQLMYALMHNIKAMDKNGKYITKEGKVVSDKKDAVSLDEMIDFKRDEKTGAVEMVLNPLVGGTTFSPNASPEQILLETRNLVKAKVMELQGNYSPELQAANQRKFWGKLGFFLRKWTLPGYHRRWRGFATKGKKKEDLLPGDVFYSEDQKSDREGFAVTGYRFTKNVLVPALMTMKMELVKKGYSELSGMERANLKKLITELSMIIISMALFAALDDDDDDDKNLLAKYLVRRQMSELMFFYDPTETYKVLSTPTASIGVLNKLIQIGAQMSNPGEVYLQGENKDRNKLLVKMLKTTPILSQVEKSTKDSLKFLEQIKSI